MSGIKDIYVTMTRNERDRLIRNAAVAQQNAQQAAYRQQQTQNALNNANSQLAALNRTLNSEIKGLNADIRQMAREQNERLARQASSFNQTIDELKLQIEDSRRELENAIAQVQENIMAKERDHKSIAEFWISQTQAFFEDIEQFRHELFTPNQLNFLRSQLNQVNADMEHESYQSAIATSRNLFNQAAQLKETVVNKEIEWSRYYTQLQNTLADVKADINYKQTLQFIIPTEDGECTIDANIDYWTNGGLSHICELVNGVEERLENVQDISTAELISIIQELQRYSEQIRLVQERAKSGIISSQLRADMAGTMADALAGAGWQCTGYTYEESEENKPLHIKFEDGNGNEIVAVISPDEMDENLANRLAVNFFDPYNNDESLRGIWIDSIKETLSETGLDVGKPVCRRGYEEKASDDTAIRDIEATARKKEI